MMRKLIARICVGTGLLVTLGFGFLLNHRNWPELALMAILYVALQLLLYGLWRWATSTTQCPQCSNTRAKLSFDSNRDEILTCELCGFQQATGASQPND